MKVYYESHELAYQQIKAKGYVGWGNAKSLVELGDEKTNLYLKNKVSELFLETQNKNALDLGCGTGTTAFILARLGFQVTGVDISPTAIEMGQEFARQQSLNIDFRIADLLEIEKMNKVFELVYDSHLLHCIVFEEDRKKILSGVKKVLAPKQGYFILDTMVMPENGVDLVKGQPNLKFDSDGILWHKTKSTEGYGIIEVNGEHWCAQRRIHRAEKILSEVKEAGFEIIAQQLDLQLGDPSMLRICLR